MVLELLNAYTHNIIISILSFKKSLPYILNKGFSGIFIDTLDNPIALSRYDEDKEKYPNMENGAINLIKTIRRNYPKIKIMVNRAFEIIPEIAPYIDYVLAESVYSGYDFELKKPKVLSENERENYTKMLKKFKDDFPHLKIMTLDYSDDKEEIKKIYKYQRENGFIPYVSTVSLDEVISEPK